MLNFKNLSYYLGLLLMWVSLLLFFLGGMFYYSDLVVFLEWELFVMFSSSLIMLFLFDWMSLLFCGFVLFISSLVMIYSNSYMEGDRFMVRFILLVYLFVLSMLLMVFSPNMISILLGWDGLGLVSYCLVIYYQSSKSAGAGMLTVLSNRIGDVAILMSIAWIFNFGSWNFNYLQFMVLDQEVLVIFVLVVVAAMTKSAQIPFSAWLPAAMAAPTPVSALVHSSTLVTAGVYLMIRFHYYMEVNLFLFYIGALTMFMSGLGANFEMDLKKIIALSTLSQLGVMMFILSMGFYELAFFHLLAHALFKSLLFLCAGVFIHGYGDCQDIRYLGGVGVSMPLSSFFFVSCSLSLCGFPFLAGFYSKDTILEVFMMGSMNLYMVVLVFLGTFFTMTYSVRLGIFLFLKNLGLKNFLGFGDSLYMGGPMMLLFSVSVVAGGALSWGVVPSYSVFLPLVMKTVFLVFGGFIFVGVYNFLYSSYFMLLYKKFSYWVSFLGTMWFLPFLSVFSFMRGLSGGGALIKYFDQGWAEKFGGQGGSLLASYAGSKMDFSVGLLFKMYLFGFFVVLWGVIVMF